uniref:Uncharacterized protein n=1 Tax=Glossina pallidipes TaxID=7398 RepID=A0A1B0AC08_GLOPL
MLNYGKWAANRTIYVMMEPMTALVLAFQLLALFSIAGALIIYLICKVRDDDVKRSEPLKSNTVLVTSADTALGLQLCTHLANKGCCVIAGMRDGVNSLPAKLLVGWLKMREFTEAPVCGTIIPILLDVTREDILREATATLGSHLCPGEQGIAAVINTSGTFCKGRIETQELNQMEQMFKTNILGSLRIAKAFVSFLRPTRGRLIYLGAGSSGGNSEGMIAYHVSRVATDKCVQELRRELQPFGVNVVFLDTCGLHAETLYKPPTAQISSGAPTTYTANVLSSNALHVVERSLWDNIPHERYSLLASNKYHFTLPCRSSLRLNNKNNNANNNSNNLNNNKRRQNFSLLMGAVQRV